MVETTKNPGDKTLSVAPTKTLTLKPRGVEQGVVRQSFSHGRTKAVVVEKVKRRAGGPIRAEAPPPATDGMSAKRPAAARPAVLPAAAPATAPTPSPVVPSPKPSGVVLRTLTEDEQKARVREAEERKIAEEEAHVRLAREAAERTEREAAEARKRGEEDRRRHDEETKRKAELEAKKRFGGEDTTAGAAARPAARPVLEADEEEAPRTTRRGGVI